MTKIALLSHRGGNIGHDLMAIGMEVALREAFGPDVRIDHFEQHNPFEVYPHGHWIRWMNHVRHGRLGFVRRYINKPHVWQKLWPQTLPLDYELAVACGGPNIVGGGAKSPELGLMLHHMNGAFHYRGVPLIDAGVGASLPIERLSDTLQDPLDRDFYSKAIEFCKLITVRDTVAAHIVRDLGFDAPLIPCGAIGTGRVFEKARDTVDDPGRHVMINFQRWGANTDWGQGVDATQWMKTMQAAIADLTQRHSVVLLAQNGFERKLAAQLAPQLPCVSPATTQEYAQAIVRAKVAIVSRIHAAIPLAGVGVPSVVIGTDTRLGTVELMGLTTRYVKHASAEWMVAQVETLLANADNERERLYELRESTIRRYAELFRTHARPPFS